MCSLVFFFFFVWDVRLGIVDRGGSWVEIGWEDSNLVEFEGLELGDLDVVWK